jgi:hypothetical protein
MWGALSDERTGMSFASVTVSSNKSVVSMYNLHFTYYYMCVYTRLLSVHAQYSRSCPIISSSCYNGVLVTWKVVCLISAKFKPLMLLYLILYLRTVPVRGPPAEKNWHRTCDNNCIIIMKLLSRHRDMEMCKETGIKAPRDIVLGSK